jgi:diguanylate cyclase (GGDEF)-like protein
MRAGKTIVVNDVSTDPDYYEIFNGVKSEMCVPLKSGDLTVGVVNIESTKLTAFTQQDQHLIEIFSSQLIVGWEKLSLFEQVQELAIRDSLTGMFNRRHFFELAEAKFAEAKRYGHPLSAIMLDVDGFKEVNDKFGHGLGDQVLETLGDVFEVGLRISDIAGRYGGDEFVVLLTGSDISAAKILSRRLDEMAKELITSGTRGTVQVTLSQGIATMDESIRSLEVLLDHADQALLIAKREGTNQVRVWGEKDVE